MKEAHAKASQTEQRIALLDQAGDCHENIIALTELLQGYAEARGAQSEVLAQTGKMIAGETEKLYSLLQTLSRRLPAGK